MVSFFRRITVAMLPVLPPLVILNVLINQKLRSDRDKMRREIGSLRWRLWKLENAPQHRKDSKIE